jgi:SAM-dependent methyltransferase
MSVSADTAPTPMASERWSGGGLARVARCPACGSVRRAPQPYRNRDYLGSDAADVWSLWRCTDCASLFLDPRPDDASIPRTYQGYYTHQSPSQLSSHGKAGGFFWAIVNDYLQRRFGLRDEPRLAGGRWLCAAIPPLRMKLDYHGRHLFVQDFPAKGTLLDVGCGNGEFLALARRMGWRAMGVEPDPHAVAACRQQGLTVYSGLIDSLPAELAGTFDVVTLSHCAEHVVDLPALLARVRDLLRANGTIWLALPNPQGLGIRLFGHAWRGLEPSRHLCVPSQRQLQIMLEQAGFEHVRAIRRGEHGKTITRESAAIARRDPSAAVRRRAWLAMPLRLAASVAATLSARWGEETVTIGKKRGN